MKKKMNLTAIIAVVMVAMSSINLVSCTADEEYGDLAFGTLANGMFTRSGENGVKPNVPIYGNPVKAGSDSIFMKFEDQMIELKVNWTRGYTGMTSPISAISIDMQYNFVQSFPEYTLQSMTGEWYNNDNGVAITIQYLKDTIYVKNDTSYQGAINKKHVYKFRASCERDATLRPSN